LLAQAIEAEVAGFLAEHADKRDAVGRVRLVRNGHLPERTVQTGIGAVAVKAPRVRDRTGELRFASAILPPYLRRTKTMEELLPWLYLKWISTRGFSEALAALLGRDAPGLSASTISRLKAVWQEERSVGEAQPGPQAVLVPVGRWDSLRRADGRGQPAHSGGDGRHGRRQERTGGAHGWVS
jgi:transposase-like protein